MKIQNQLLEIEHRDLNPDISLHDNITYSNAKAALRYVNHALEDADNLPKTGIYQEAGNTVIEMLNAVIERDSYLGADNSKYEEFLGHANDLILDIINKSLIQLSEDEIEPDKTLFGLVNYIAVMGTRLSEVMLDYKEDKSDNEEILPDNFVKLMILDKICAEYHKVIENDVLPGRVSVDAFSNDLSYVSGIINDTRSDIKKSAIKRLYESSADKANEIAMDATIAIKHIFASLAKEDDDNRRMMYEKSYELIKGMKSALLSDDLVFSSKQLFDAEKEIFLSDTYGSSKDIQEWELDATMNKLDSYGNLLDGVNELIRDISGYELIEDGGCEGNPDRSSLLTIHQLRKMFNHMDHMSALMLDMQLTPRMESLYLDEFASKLQGNRQKWEEVRGKMIEAYSLYNVCNGIMDIYSEEIGDVIVLNKRVSDTVFNRAEIIARAPESGAAQRLTQYLEEQSELEGSV